MHLFYAPEISSSPFLPPDESLHAVKVLRLATGSEIGVIDGCGGYFRAQITLLNPKHCGVEIVERLAETVKRDYRLHIAIAPTKSIDRTEWFVEKAVETGIDEITPVFCRFSERKNVNVERLAKIVIAACKQSQQARFPKINVPLAFSEFIKQDVDGQCFIAHCYAAEKRYLGDVLQPKKPITLLVGPEGDFSEAEVQAALDNGFTPVTLGNNRLRTETAGVVASVIAGVVNNLK
jgi:16S rRNA (uracil1498-N3)-methyltransferase